MQISDQPALPVPDDFPLPPEILGSVSGAASKLLLVKDGELYSSAGQTQAERCGRWAMCEDLANQLATAALNSKAGKRAHMSEIDILAQYLPRLIEKKWASPPECRWIIRRTASLLDWPIPEAATCL